MIRTLTLLLILTLFAGVSGTMPAQAAGAVQLTHIHGMSYSADGARLLIPSHHGLAIFENGAKPMGQRTTSWASRPPGMRCTAVATRHPIRAWSTRLV